MNRKPVLKPKKKSNKKNRIGSVNKESENKACENKDNKHDQKKDKLNEDSQKKDEVSQKKDEVAQKKDEVGRNKTNMDEVDQKKDNKHKDNKIEDNKANDDNKLNNSTTSKNHPKSRGKKINIAAIRKIAQERRELEEKIKKEKEEAERRHQEELRKREMERERIKKEQEALKEIEKARKSLQRMKILRSVGKEKKKIETKQIAEQKVNENLKSPICCILGHVDTGKTKILDKLRESDVQASEAGGITQQIGATLFPAETIRQKCPGIETELPGILVIDTPGHESFTNLRSRGSSLCDLAILVVDILHLLEKQTIESIELLKMRKTPFVIALNKIDRLFEWRKGGPGFQESLATQTPSAVDDFRKRLDECILQLAEIGLNGRLFYENKDERRVISIVPTSAITGEGLPDLLRTICRYTETFMRRRIAFKEELSCTVLEVKEEAGIGATLDVILSNGRLREGDKICVCGSTGPIVTTIRALLIPQPLKELRIKSVYVQKKEVRASLGVKIAATDLGTAIAGSRVLNYCKGVEEEVMADMKSVLDIIETVPVGIHVQTSTLGSLEAFLEFVKSRGIPVSSIGVGLLSRKDVNRVSVMREHAPEYAAMLCFDIKVDREIQEFAASMHVRIFTGNIIYNLIDAFENHLLESREREKKNAEGRIVYPFRARIIPEYVFTTRPPFVFGVEVLTGCMRCNTPVFVCRDGEIMRLGKIISIRNGKDDVGQARAGEKVSIKIESDSSRTYGRHFDHNDMIESYMTRASIDLLKKFYRDELTQDELRLIVDIKRKLGIF